MTIKIIVLAQIVRYVGIAPINIGGSYAAPAEHYRDYPKQKSKYYVTNFICFPHSVPPILQCGRYRE